MVTDTLPSLPMTIDNMAGALIGDLLYIVGGNVNGVPSADMYSLDLSNMDKGWQKEPGVPGEPRVQPVCAAQGGKLYVWGGFAPAADGREATLSVDGYVYSPETRVWTSVATPVDKEGKSISLGGGAAVPWGEEAILCIGGVNKDIFLKALQGIYSGKNICHIRRSGISSIRICCFIILQKMNGALWANMNREHVQELLWLLTEFMLI